MYDSFYCVPHRVFWRIYSYASNNFIYIKRALLHGQVSDETYTETNLKSGLIKTSWQKKNNRGLSIKLTQVYTLYI